MYNSCDSRDRSLSGSSLYGISQARIMEWGAISFSRGSSQPRNWTRVSCIAGKCFTLWATREQNHDCLWKTNQYDLFSSCTTNLKCMPLRYVQGCWTLIGWGLLVGLSIPMGSGSAAEAWCRRRGMPWWLSGREPTCQCMRHGFDPWSWKIPHAEKQLSPCSPTAEPVL